MARGDSEKLSPLFSWRSAICDSDLPPTVRHVALTLSLHMNERGGSCFPALVTLASETGRSKSTVIDALKVLQNQGWLTKRLGGGRERSNRYTAQVPETVKPQDPLLDRLEVETVKSTELNGPATRPEDVILGRKAFGTSKEVPRVPSDPRVQRLVGIYVTEHQRNFGARPSDTSRMGTEVKTQLGAGWTEQAVEYAILEAASDPFGAGALARILKSNSKPYEPQHRW